MLQFFSQTNILNQISDNHSLKKYHLTEIIVVIYDFFSFHVS